MKRFISSLCALSILFACTQEEPAPIRVESIELDSEELELIVGNSISLVATILPEDAENQNVIWSSSNKAVASVKDGEVTAVSVGEATITAKSEDGGKKATCVVTVNPKHISVTALSLDKTEVEMNPDDKVMMTATIAPENASNKSVLWTSSDESIATVKDGEVTALKVGEATITATSEDGGKKATCKVVVSTKHIPVSSVTLDKEEVSLVLEDKMTLTATVTPDNASNKTIVWTSSDESIATVKDGEVTALKVGEATISATSEDGGKKATCKVTVNAKPVPVTGVSLNKQKARVFINDELTLTATVAPEDATNKTLVWTTSNALVATVKNGVVKGISVGEADITVKTEDGNHSATCKVSVTEESQTQTKGPLTLDLGTVTSTTATFNGFLDVDMLGDYDTNAGGVGFIYAPADQPLNIVTSSKVQISEVDAQGKFTHTLTGLKYNSEYHYAIFVYKNTICQYGETQVFKTVPVDIELSVKDITQTRATISGRLTLPENDKELEVGVLCSTSSDMTIATEGVKKAVVTDIMDTDGGFTVLLSGLATGTKYYYCGYVYNGGSYTYEAPAEFTTLKHPYHDLSFDLDVISATDLSSSGSANCYIVSNTGLYKFKPVQGNRHRPVGDVVSASILWETFGTDTAPEFLDLISGFCYKDGYIVFQTADIFKEGNAVIAAKDADGKILWSWHIWLTDQPQAQVYNNDAGTMMDRNLGATSATPGDVGALGLLYQWGRKDPFLGSSSISDEVEAKSTIAWPSIVSSDSSNGTIDYATANPTTFITYNRRNYDWWYGYDEFVTIDNTRWTTSSKSIYDPCPAGWRVPDGGSNGIWSKAGFDDTTYDGTNEGMSFSISSPSTTWYPASGYRSGDKGRLRNVSYYGYYWSASPSRLSASPYSYYAYSLYFHGLGSVNPSDYYNRAYGLSVRCLQE